jgi:DNA-binding transcriptional regulator GbsR (MarR family)
MNYKVPVIEYSGELTGLAGQRIAQWEVFTKINSTGSRLTKNEIRHAHATPMFHAASHLEKRWYKRMVETWRVFSKGEADRYQYHEMMLELCTIDLYGGISDRRLRLDEFMRLDTLTKARISKAERAVSQAVQWARTIVKDDGIRRSRLSKKVDFYSFIGTLMELQRQRTVRSNSTYNRHARKAVRSALDKLSKVDGRIARYSFSALPSREKQLANYIVATREATDQLRNRQVRHDFWYGILAPCFPRKMAARRLFGRDLKNALWNAAKVQYGRMRCPNPQKRDECWGHITYDQAVVDHRKAYSRGGTSSLENAQLLCGGCNSAKRDR